MTVCVLFLEVVFPFFKTKVSDMRSFVVFIYPFLTMCSDTQSRSWPWTRVEVSRCESLGEHAWRYSLLPNDGFMRLPPPTRVSLPSLHPTSDFTLPLCVSFLSPTKHQIYTSLCLYFQLLLPRVPCFATSPLLSPPMSPPTPFFISVGNNNTQCGCR